MKIDNILELVSITLDASPRNFRMLTTVSLLTIIEIDNIFEFIPITLDASPRSFTKFQEVSQSFPADND